MPAVGRSARCEAAHAEPKERYGVKIRHDLYDPDVSLNLAYHSGTITGGNKYKLINNRFHYDLRKYYFSASYR